MEFLRKTILGTFPKILAFADEHRVCKRKSVGVGILQVLSLNPDLVQTTTFTTNGPSGGGHECTNVVGNCGCSHAEPRAIMKLLKILPVQVIQGREKGRVLLVSTYSPCTNCANIIIDSGVVDAVCYDILTEHDKRGAEFLRMEMPVFTKAELEAGDAPLRKWLIHS